MKSAASRFFLAIVPLAPLGMPLLVSSADAATVTLAPHRAVYDIQLERASDRSGITSMNGRIVYEFQGSACDGYTTSFRFVTRIGAGGEARVTDQRTTTFEDGEGKNFRFVTKTYVNDRFDRQVSGTATSGDEGIDVALSKPVDAEHSLSPAFFPSEHMIDLLQRASRGETFYEQRIFDGSDNGDEVMTTTVIIGPEKTEPFTGVPEELADAPYRNVSIAYFADAEAGEGEALPEYGIGFKMFENGITGDLKMDYGDFSLAGQMAEFELLETESCP